MKIASATQRSTPPSAVANTCSRPRGTRDARIGQQIGSQPCAGEPRADHAPAYSGRSRVARVTCFSDRLAAPRLVVRTITGPRIRPMERLHARAARMHHPPRSWKKSYIFRAVSALIPGTLREVGRLARSIAFRVPKWRSSARLRVGPDARNFLQPGLADVLLAPGAVRADGEAVRLVAQPLDEIEHADRAAAA